MECLYCGHCCEQLNPFNDKDRCRYTKRENGFSLCSVYTQRPKVCKDHYYPFKYCPIGIERLKIDTPLKLAMRIDEGWDIANNQNAANAKMIDPIEKGMKKPKGGKNNDR